MVIFIASAHAVTYKINGVKQDKLKDNIRLHLNNLDVETELLNDPFWQDEVIATVATAVQPFGYYNSNATVEVTKDDEVVVTVSLSDPLLVSKVATLEAVLMRFHLKKEMYLISPFTSRLSHRCSIMPYLMVTLISIGRPRG